MAGIPAGSVLIPVIYFASGQLTDLHVVVIVEGSLSSDCRTVGSQSVTAGVWWACCLRRAPGGASRSFPLT